MSKKYKFTGKTIEHVGITLKQIKRLSDGLVGGYIQSEDNLSHDGNCFVYENARVFGDAKIFENAEVYGNAEVFGDAVVFGNAEVFGDAKIFENAEVFGDAGVYDDAEVHEDARVHGNADVYGNAVIKTPYCVQSILGYKYNIIITKEYARFGCKTLEWNNFEKKAKKLGKEEGLGDEEINMLIDQAKASLRYIKFKTK